MAKVCILGAGSWGTALASVLNDNKHDVVIWGRNREQVQQINTNNTNSKYLPNVVLDKKIVATNDLFEAIENAELVVLAVPSQQIRNICVQIKNIIQPWQILVNVAKGMENHSALRLSQVCKQQLPENSYSVLSGPSHAEEVVNRIPTVVVASSSKMCIADKVQDFFINEYFKVYTNHDLLGVEIGGATKNIIAFGAGIADGLGLGDNSKAALMTRGMCEIKAFGVALGAESETFAGLTGMGDLIVTCTSMHSRNRRAGILIGKGHNVEQTQKEIGMVVEGIAATKVIYEMSQRIGVKMPITEAIYKIIEGKITPEQAVASLMRRLKRHENDL